MMNLYPKVKSHSSITKNFESHVAVGHITVFSANASETDIELSLY